MDIKMNKLKITLAMTLLFAMSVSAKSQTGLSSSLITHWHSEVSRKVCPDFRYPSFPPSIVSGEKVYQANCAQCHGSTPSTSTDIVNKMRKGTPEKQFEFVCGGTNHSFAKALTVDQRWEALMYLRAHTLGFFPKGGPEEARMNALFGGNCAVCHGTRGQGDGNLHKTLNPQPANFTMSQRLYTRSDEKLFNEISYGIPWTGMPAWKGRYDFDKHENFDEAMVWDLVRYVRSFGYSQELHRLELGRERIGNYKNSIKEGQKK